MVSENYFKIRRTPGRLSSIFLIVFLLCSCKNCTSSYNKNNINTEDNPVFVKYARHFDLSPEEEYTRLTIINPWQKSSGVRIEYYLVKRGIQLPEYIDSVKVIRVPVKKVVLMSTTYLPMIMALGAVESVKGISGTNFVYDTLVKRKITEGQIVEVGYEENLNKELIFKLSPEVIIAYGVGSEAKGNMSKLEESGIRILFNADFLEELPLGRTEWLKVLGALYCREREADSIFSIVEKEYLEIKSYISERVQSRPNVMLGLPWQDSWYVSPGNSYISSIIEDAGGYYLWKEMKADYSVPLGIENVFVKALKAEFWLNTGDAPDMKTIISIDKRLAYLNPVIKGNVYNNNKRVSEGGGNDYWESGALYPQKILKDIASILHPELFPDHEWFYYKKIE